MIAQSPLGFPTVHKWPQKTLGKSPCVPLRSLPMPAINTGGDTGDNFPTRGEINEPSNS
jgi:hypothetical protein